MAEPGVATEEDLDSLAQALTGTPRVQVQVQAQGNPAGHIQCSSHTAGGVHRVSLGDPGTMRLKRGRQGVIVRNLNQP